jgi:hypothetical protein
MRIKSSQQYFDFSEPSSLKIVLEYRQKYQKISDLMDQNPQIRTLAHMDWAKLLSSSRITIEFNGPDRASRTQRGSFIGYPADVTARQRWPNQRARAI